MTSLLYPKVNVEVEVREDRAPYVTLQEVRSYVEKVLRECHNSTYGGPETNDGHNDGFVHDMDITKWLLNQNFTQRMVANIISAKIVDCNEGVSNPYNIVEWQVYVFNLSQSEPGKDYLDGEEDICACEQWELTSSLLHGIWESIVVESSIKKQLLGYVSTSMQFSMCNVDPLIVAWNRMIMLYGPPGTGKTSLCKALAHKAYIRHAMGKYSSGLMLEINAHSLFSKWFSESGKLVMKLFDHISEIAEDQDCFLCVLIDEVESIVGCRAMASSGNEPGDAVRVVNAVLTSLDALRRRCNVLILTTSNLIENIDDAFRDRLDLMINVGNPPMEARHQIITSCVKELLEKGVLVNAVSHDNGLGVCNEPLHEIANLTEGMSGRALRKLCLQTHCCYFEGNVDLAEFLRAMIELLKCQDDTNSI